MARPLDLHVYPGFSRMNDFAMRKTDVSTCYAVFSIFEARKRLKAICRNSASRAFLINLGNLARYALLYKWLNPKYCSTIYRTLEIALLRAISYSVSSVLVVAFRLCPSGCIMPSAILFRARKSRLGFPKYPLSA